MKLRSPFGYSPVYYLLLRAIVCSRTIPVLQTYQERTECMKKW